MQSVVVDVTKFHKKLGAAREKSGHCKNPLVKPLFFPLKALGNKSVITFLKKGLKSAKWKHKDRFEVFALFPKSIS